MKKFIIKIISFIIALIGTFFILVWALIIAENKARKEVTIYLDNTSYYAVSGNDTISKHRDLNEVIKDLEAYKIVGIEDLTCK